MVKQKEKNYILGTELGTKGPEFNVFEKIGLGVASGALKIPEAIAELGAGFIDYALDTDLVSALERNFPRINVTDGVGKFVEIIVQYGVPYSAALKIGGKLHGMKKLKDLGQGSSKISKIAGKMGYYGLPAIATDTLVGAARDVTLGETFGLYKGYEEGRKGKVGQELAGEVLKQRALLGLEGGALAGLITTALPPALGATASGVALGAGYVSRGVSPIINPVAQLVGNSAVGTGARKTLDAIKFAKEKIDPLSLNQLRFQNSSQMNLFQRFKKRVGDLITPQGPMTRQQFESFQNLENTVKMVRGDLNFFIPRVEKEITKAIKTLSLSRGESLTKQQAILEDIARALDPQTPKGLKSFKNRMQDIFGVEESKNLIDAVTNTRVLADDLNKKVIKNFATPVLGKKGKIIESSISEEVSGLLNRQVTTAYKAFDNSSKFKFSGKVFEQNKKAAIDDAVDELSKGVMKGKGKESIRAQAKKEVEQLIRLAENSGSEGNFFFRIRDLKETRPKEYYLSISKEMAARRSFDIPGSKYALSLRNLLGGELNPTKAFTNKYMTIASELGKKKHINQIVQFNDNLGPAVAGRAEKFMFTPTKTKEKLLKEGVDPATAQNIVNEDLIQQIAKEYNIRPETVNLSRINPSTLTKKVEDPYGVYDSINPLKAASKSVGGYHTSSGVAQALAGVENYTDFLVNLPLYKTFLMGKAGTQVGKTILSPVTQIRNFTSAGFFALHNGHMGNPFGFRKGTFSFADVLKQHVEEIFPDGVTNQRLKELALEASRKNELGVTSGSIVQREIDDLLKDVAKDGASYKTTEDIFNKIFRSPTFKETYNKAQQFYTKGDDIWKDYGYRFTLSQLNKAFEGKPNDAATIKLIEKAHLQVFGRRPNVTGEFGKLKSKDELLEEFSAEYIKNTYPNYQYVPTAVKELRRLPIGNFISFPAEILRTSGNLVQLTGRELAINTGDAAVDAYFRQMGSRRLIGQMAGYATGPALAAYSLKALGMTEEQSDALKEDNVAEWNKFSDLIIIEKKKEKDDNVKYRYLNFAYQNPYDYIRAPFYTFFGRMASGKKMEEEDVNRFVNSSFEAFRSLFEPFIDEAILTERISDLIFRGGRTRSGSLVFDENDEIGDRLAKGFGHIVKGVSPGVLTQVSNVASAVAQDETRYGKQYQLGDELLALLSGIRVYEADIANNLNYAVNDFRRANFINKRNAGNLIFAANVTPNTISSAYQEYVDESYKTYKKTRKTIDDAIKLGVPELSVFKILEQRRVQKDIVNTLRTKKFIPPNYMTFFRDQRFQNIIRERGRAGLTLFPFRELEGIRSRYLNIDLFKSLDDVRRTIDRESIPTVPEQGTTAQGTTVQGQGTTVQGQGLATPAAGPSTGQIAGLTKTPTEKFKERDPLAVDVLESVGSAIT